MAPPIPLPRQRRSVTVRLGGLHEDLDALHDGDPLWWGKDFVAGWVRSMPPDTPHLMLIGELDCEPVADAYLIGKGIAQNGYAGSGVYVLPHARGGARCWVVDRTEGQHALTMRARGHHRIFTQNMEQNAPILAANDRLGFGVVPGY